MTFDKLLELVLKEKEKLNVPDENGRITKICSACGTNIKVRPKRQGNHYEFVWCPFCMDRIFL